VKGHFFERENMLRDVHQAERQMDEQLGIPHEEAKTRILGALKAPSYQGCKPASIRASTAARGASRKQDTRCEKRLRSALWSAGCRYLTNVDTLPGKPDIVFPKARVAIFCDGDFWHGRDWECRRERLKGGNNPQYWTKKIQANMDRDRRNTADLVEEGWIVLRFWESTIRKDLATITQVVLGILDERGHRKRLYEAQEDHGLSPASI